MQCDQPAGQYLDNYALPIAFVNTIHSFPTFFGATFRDLQEKMEGHKQISESLSYKGEIVVEAQGEVRKRERREVGRRGRKRRRW